MSLSNTQYTFCLLLVQPRNTENVPTLLKIVDWDAKHQYKNLLDLNLQKKNIYVNFVNNTFASFRKCDHYMYEFKVLKPFLKVIF